MSISDQTIRKAIQILQAEGAKNVDQALHRFRVTLAEKDDAESHREPEGERLLSAGKGLVGTFANDEMSAVRTKSSPGHAIGEFATGKREDQETNEAKPLQGQQMPARRPRTSRVK